MTDWRPESLDRVERSMPEGSIERVVAAGRLVFGDRTGVAIWLGLVLSLGLCWRVGFFITDTYPIANAVVSLADGRLAMSATDFEYSLTLGTQPGLHRYDGAYYARNYGHVVAALPILFVLETVSVVGPPRLVLAAGWSLGVLLFGRQLAVLLDRPAIRPAAGLVAVSSFLLAVALATALPHDLLPLVALQLSTLFAAGLAGVWCYRLVALFHERRVAVVAGVGLVLATPVGFWATIPKRHVLVTALLVASVYAFALSRTTDDVRGDLALGGAYAFLGLIAWVHAFEGFFLVLSLFVVDVVTEPRKGRRRIAVTVGLFGLSLLPMFVTNVLISGTPLRPPRLLPQVDTGSVDLRPETATGGLDGGDSGANAGRAGGENPGSTESEASSPLDRLVGRIAPVLGFAGIVRSEIVFVGEYAVDVVDDGLRAVTDLDRLWNVFVRRTSGNNSPNDYEPIDLSVLESTPVLGALAAVPPLGAAWLWRGRISIGALSARRQTDLLVCTQAAIFSVVYLPQLPLYSQITTRYLLPVMALAAYGTVRLPAVRDAINTELATFVATYGLAVVGGIVTIWLGLGSFEPAIGEAVQFHATLGLLTGGALAVAVGGRTVAPGWVHPRTVAVSLGVAGGVTTVFIVLAALEYFAYGTFASDVAATVARHVSLL